ncbi:MAG: deoxyribose-phosphate aldolase [Flavobacteriales bacterium]|nr:deoxyribose-phosphate aldolase [Flavobacteriales bacterium]
MEINKYIESTFLKTEQETGLQPVKHLREVYQCILDAHENTIFAVVVRPENVSLAKSFYKHIDSKSKVVTVISFPDGNHCSTEKLSEAEIAINRGADELDFVINYNEFKKGNHKLILEEFINCTRFCLEKGKVVKWIIETAALTEEEIISICELLSRTAQEEFSQEQLNSIFLKSSTGYYDAVPNGASKENIELMIKHGSPLPVKASGGIKTKEDAEKYIALGVKRIGTSNALKILGKSEKTDNY